MANMLLTDRQKLFCREYIKDDEFNATNAAIRAGYSKNGAQQAGSNCLQKISVQAEIARLNKKRFAKLDDGAKQVIQNLAVIANSNITDVFEEAELEGETDFLGEPVAPLKYKKVKDFADMKNTGAISSMEVGANGTKVKFWDKNRANENLGKHHNLFNDKKEITVNMNSGNLSNLTDEELATLKALQEKMVR